MSIRTLPALMFLPPDSASIPPPDFAKLTGAVDLGALPTITPVLACMAAAFAMRRVLRMFETPQQRRVRRMRISSSARKLAVFRALRRGRLQPHQQRFA